MTGRRSKPDAGGDIVLCMTQLNLSARAYAQHNIIASEIGTHDCRLGRKRRDPIRTLGKDVAIPSEVGDRRAAFLSEEAELQIVLRVMRIYSLKRSSEKKGWLEQYDGCVLY